MIDIIDRLYKQLDILNAHPDFNESCTIIAVLDAINALTRLTAIIKENEADAKRYRWAVSNGILGTWNTEMIDDYMTKDAMRVKGE